MPSMRPQARLQPSAPMSIMRTSSRVASATLSEPVKARTMINPKRTSDTRSIGSRTRLEDFTAASAMGMKRWRFSGEKISSARRQEVERHGENHVDREHHHAGEPGRPSAAGDEGGGERRHEHHDHGTGPKLEIHRRRPDEVAEQHQQRRDEERDLRRAAEGDAHAEVEAVLARP